MIGDFDGRGGRTEDSVNRFVDSLLYIDIKLFSAEEFIQIELHITIFVGTQTLWNTEILEAISSLLAVILR